MVSIVIPHHSDRNLLSYCLSALLPTIAPDVEVIVVLNNADKGEINVELDESRIEAIRVPENLGSAGAYRLGIEKARSDTIVLLDNDAMVTRGWLEPLLDLLARHEKAAAVSAKMVNLSTGRIIDYGIAFTPYNAPHPFFDRPADFVLATKDRHVQAACSAAMAVRRSPFQAVGGFSRTGTAHYNDIELCLKLNASGYQVWVSGQSLVYHKSSYPGAKVAPYKAPALKADQKGRFMADYGHLIRYDMEPYYEESFNYFKGLRRVREDGFILVDMSSVVDRPDYHAIIKKFLNISDIYSIPSFSRDDPHIDLLGRLPVDLARNSAPLVYFVDRFVALSSNTYWFLTRGHSEDLIVDRNGNVLTVSDLQAGA
jgi:glycosyltransferase involved in cell wall biosynthesis